MTMRWGEDTTVKFVKEYLKNECLYNHMSPLYKDKRSRMAAYQKIQETMDLPGFGISEVKIKIKNLRSTYSQEIKKISESRRTVSDESYVYVPAMKWFQPMDEKLNMATSSRSYRDDSADYVHLKCEIDDNVEAGDIPEFIDVSTYDCPTPLPTSTTSKKRKRGNANHDDEYKIDSALQPVMSTQKLFAADEFDAFGINVAFHLRNMPLTDALQIETEIQSLITKRRIEILHRNNGSSSSGLPSNLFNLDDNHQMGT